MWDYETGFAQAEQDRLTALWDDDCSRLNLPGWKQCRMQHDCAQTPTSAAQALLACKTSPAVTYRTPVLIELLWSFSANFCSTMKWRAQCMGSCVISTAAQAAQCVFSTAVSCVTLFWVQPLLYTGLISNPRLWCYYFSCFSQLDSQIHQQDAFIYLFIFGVWWFGSP